ncbi:hypothetical protein JZ751_019372 [Albula glossodonta]|uniref:Uncharacterized protein n=1 Tax=Albula glossodonta TaxID=121402 RepID=A0A8T2NQ03_9TELE|nr:hypothetical protein JZ751_019372 [Albula glossodonta]
MTGLRARRNVAAYDLPPFVALAHTFAGIEDGQLQSAGFVRAAGRLFLREGSPRRTARLTRTGSRSQTRSNLPKASFSR